MHWRKKGLKDKYNYVLCECGRRKERPLDINNLFDINVLTNLAKLVLTDMLIKKFG